MVTQYMLVIVMIPMDEGEVFQKMNEKICLQLIRNLEKIIMKMTLKPAHLTI